MSGGGRLYGEDEELERIDLEMRLEKIRGTAEKLSWDGFGQSQRRNLMEKRITFDAETRMDVLQALATMKRNIPVDLRGDLQSKLRQLAESLECSITPQPGLFQIRNTELVLELQADSNLVTAARIGYFNRSLIPSPEIQQYINDNQYAQLRSAIQNMLSAVPSTHTSVEKQACVLALELIESNLLLDLPSQPSTAPLPFSTINELPRGLLRPRSAVRPPQIFYIVEPSYAKSARRDFSQDEDFDKLPYLELLIVQNDKETELPAGGPGNAWSQVRPSPSCVCLKFCEPFLFSYTHWRRLEKYLVRPSIVKSHVNLFKYMSSFNFKETEMILRTRFPSGHPNQKYVMDSESLKSERDVVIGEIYLKDVRNLDKVLEILRAQWRLNSIWESVLAMCHMKWTGTESVQIKLTPATDSSGIECSFAAKGQLVIVNVSHPIGGKWLVQTRTADGHPLNVKLDEKLQNILTMSSSLPVTLAAAIAALQATPTADPPTGGATHPTHLPHRLTKWKMEAENDISNSIDSNDFMPMKEGDFSTDKVGFMWLSVSTKTKGSISPDYIYEIESDEDSLALLSTFREVDEDFNKPAQIKPDARAHRHMSTDIAAAVSDLELLREGINKYDEYGPSSGFGTPTAYTPTHPGGGHYGSEFRPPFESPRHSGGHGHFPGQSQPGVSPFAQPHQPPPHFPTTQHQQLAYGGGYQQAGHHHMTGYHQIGHQQGMTPGQTGAGQGGGHVQLSPLESARLRLGNTISANMAMSMATSQMAQAASGSTSAGSGSNTADVFDFADEKSPISAYNSPSGYPPFGGFSSGSPMSQSQQMRGQVPKRRGQRGRRSSNVGDRLSTESQESNSSVERGGRTARRPRGSRKATVAHMTHAELAEQNRLLQRSLSSVSDYSQSQLQQAQQRPSSSLPQTPQTPLSNAPPALVSSGTRVSATYESPFDEESDEECDPPRQPKPISQQTQSQSRTSQSQDSQNQSIPQLTAQKPIKLEEGQAFQSPRPGGSASTDSTTVTPAESPASSASLQPPTLHPITTTASSVQQLTTSSPSIAGARDLPSPSLSSIPPTRTQPSRKYSLEAISNKLIRNSQGQQQQTSVPKPKHFSDIYDDGTSPPPSAVDKLPPQLSAAVASSSAGTSQTFSPQMNSSPRESSNDSTSSGTQKSDSAKLVLKIPKTSDTREKIKILKKEKKPEKDKLMSKNKEKQPSKERKKRPGDDSLGKERETKKHKSSDAGMTGAGGAGAKPPTTPIINQMLFSNPLKNFKIPKKDTTDESKESKDKDSKDRDSKEPNTPTGSGPSTSLSTPANQIPLPPGSGPPRSILKKSDRDRDRDRDRDKERSSSGTSEHAIPSHAPPPPTYPPPPTHITGPSGRPVQLPPPPQIRGRGRPRGNLIMPHPMGRHPMGGMSHGGYMHGEAMPHMPYKVSPVSRVPPPPPPNYPPPPGSSGGSWIRPPVGQPPHPPPYQSKQQSPQNTPRSPSPDAMRIEDANSPEDSLRIADD